MGIQQGASTDEIKRAYRKKAKECHPDIHPNDPKAHENMQQVNEACDMLMNPGKHQAQQQRQQARQNGGQGGTYSQGGYSQSNNYGRHQAAVNVLNAIPSSGRDARWYYLSSLANHGLGNSIAAMEQMQRAVQLDPNNQVYHQLLQQYRRTSQSYEQNARSYNSGFDPSKLCLGFCATQMLCNCCFCR